MLGGHLFQLEIRKKDIVLLNCNWPDNISKILLQWQKQTTNVYMLALGLADNSCPEKLKVHRLTTGCKNIDAFLRGKYERYKL